ncbi:predicted protein [Nematostella vectensis]|uniref:Major facilitator superfamily domain-containing protein 12 n=1 Tax=Nematostella vectensis TaxID=45351 RepID=A7S679_NEMVE|nr:predicted protein [Nematostella vectensis]|eukprot:XP_001632829.1 predicted protein [Nematostella vectensis]
MAPETKKSQPAVITKNGHPDSEEKLSNQQRFCYGVGHIQNDLLTYAAFSYLLVFLTKVIGISSSSTGIIFLCGQITNSFLSPVIGYACDRWKVPFISKFGRRKAWHLVGVVVLFIAVPFLFMRCTPCADNPDEWMLLFNYIAVTVSMNFGFTAVEISHLSLLPKIAIRHTDFVKLNSLRTAWMFISGIMVYGLMWMLLGNSSGESLDHNQWKEFMSLGMIITGVGLFFSATFHIGTKEPKKEHKYGKHGNHPAQTVLKNARQKPMSAKKWFRKPEFYTLCMVFMCTKIVINVSNSYFPLYLVDVLHLEKEAIAYFPLIVLVASAVFSYLSKRITKLLGNKVSYCLASGMVIGAFVWFYFQTIGAKDAIYGAAILMGGGYSVMLVTMLTMVAEMINHIDKSGAFVYGAASLLDKLGNGVLIAIVQEFYPKSDR